MLRLSLLLVAASPIATAAAQTQVTPPPVTEPEPATPTPEPTPTPTPSASPTAAPSPTSTPRPVPSPTSTPEAAEEPATQPTIDAEPTPEPEATPEPLPTPEPVASPEPATDLPGAVTTTVADDARPADTGGGGGWLLWAGIALIVGAALIVGRIVLPRRRARSAEPDEAPIDPPHAPPIVPVRGSARPADPPSAPVAAVPVIDFHPSRIGLNLLSVTASGEVAIRNDAAVAMHDVRVRASLLAAAAGHEDAVAALHRNPAARLAAPPFALEAGAGRAVRLIVATPRSAIEPLGVAGRPMMVPLVAIAVDWRDGAGEHRRTQAFAVGVQRVDSAKLAPIWLDQDSRTFDAVAARPHGAVLG